MEDFTCITEGFVAQLVHDLKIPLIPIGGYARRLREEKLGPLDEQQKEALDIIIQNAARLEQDLGFILDYIRTDKDLVSEGSYESFDLKEGLANRVKQFEPRAYELGVSLEFKAPLGPVPIKADPVLIEKAVSNLIDNALKYTSSGGRVIVALSASEDLLEIEVSDTGAGFDPESLELIFKPFEQIMALKNLELRGVGLGLSSVKRYIELLGGQIKVRSEPGRGSSFTLLLPEQRKAE